MCAVFGSERFDGLSAPARRSTTAVDGFFMRPWYIRFGALAISVAAISASAEGSDRPSGTSIMMFLQNFPAPFVDRSLAAQIGRSVLNSKYPIATLSGDAPEISDQGETWLVTFKVARWTKAVQLFRDIKAIPISIRKRDAAIIDIFPHDMGSDEDPASVRKRMTTDPACKKCHLTLHQP